MLKNMTLVQNVALAAVDNVDALADLVGLHSHEEVSK